MRALLELAAKAAGFKGEPAPGDCLIGKYSDELRDYAWRPQTLDEQAFELLARLRIRVEPLRGSGVRVVFDDVAVVVGDKCPRAALRMAVVKLAAMLGARQ